MWVGFFSLLNREKVSHTFLCTLGCTNSNKCVDVRQTFILSYRPGFIRLSIPYFMSKEEIDFIIESVKWVAEFGWKLLPQVYRASVIRKLS